MPSEGTIDWHLPLNANFENLDTDVEIRDLDDNRGSYDPKSGAKYLATDTGNVYIGTGSGWNHLGSLSQGTGESTDTLLSKGNIVVSANGLTGTRTVVPSQSSTPVQDALDLCGEHGGGVVQLPYTTVNEDGPIHMHDNCALKGKYGSSVIQIQNTGTHGIVFDVDQSPYGSGVFLQRVELDGFTLRGPGVTANTGNAIRDRGFYESRIGQLRIENWNGIAYKVEQGAVSFENDIEYLKFMNCDAGNARALIDWNSTGAPNRIGTIAAYPTDNASGSDSTILHGGGIHARIDTINVGGTGGRVFYNLLNGLSIGIVNWEPSRQNSIPHSLFGVYDSSGFQVEQLTIFATTKYAYDVYKGGRMNVPKPDLAGTLQNNVLDLKTAPGGPITYHGSSSEVDGKSNDTDNLLTTIADL